MIGGVQAGYNVRLPSGLLFGVEADLTFPNYLISNSIVAVLATPASEVVEQLDYVGTVRGRLGYASGPLAVLCHRRLGLCRRAVHSTRRHIGDGEKHVNVRLGWAAGAGIEYALRAALERASWNISTTGSRMPTSGWRRARIIRRA